MSKSQASAAAAVVAAAGAAAAAASTTPTDSAGAAAPGETTGEVGAGVQAISASNPAVAPAVVDEAELQRISAEAAAGDRAAEAVATAEAVAATHVDARVLADCEFGKPNELASVPVERVEELEKSFVIDTHPEAVRYAKRLADGEISA